jgi:hypothetical protein
MKYLVSFLFLLSVTYASGGSVEGGGNSGGGGTKPTKDERVYDINSGKVQVIDLADRFGSTIGVKEPVKPTRIKQEITLPLNQIEEVTLKDGTVLSNEEIWEHLYNSFKK